MKYELYWRLFAKTKSIDKAGKILERFLRETKVELNVISKEVYWKDSSLIQIEGTTDLDSFTPGSLIHEVLLCIKKVSAEWSLSIHEGQYDGYLDLSGITDKSMRISGLTWVSFTMQEVHLE
ncbi:hypothetical protein [Roseivirga sp.]|uniref:hypothetical protein n=1 Tax=Roseivirga sp. TaxID=1964215 RepID=UPI003B525856